MKRPAAASPDTGHSNRTIPGRSNGFALGRFRTVGSVQGTIPIVPTRNGWELSCVSMFYVRLGRRWRTAAAAVSIVSASKYTGW
jgi:hypothetical protein